VHEIKKVENHCSKVLKIYEEWMIKHFSTRLLIEFLLHCFMILTFLCIAERCGRLVNGYDRTRRKKMLILG